MAPATTNYQPFRFLDLPVELRCWIYSRIDFPTLWHILDRAPAMISESDWPVPPKAQQCDSCVTLIRPYFPVDILLTCHLVYKEARPILQSTADKCRRMPLRYLVDYSAAWALVKSWSPLSQCLGKLESSLNWYSKQGVKDFVELCMNCSAQTRVPRVDSEDVHAIELTITHESDVVYGGEVLKTMLELATRRYFGFNRLVVIYKSPLPWYCSPWDVEPQDSRMVESFVTEQVGTEEGVSDRPYGVFMRPLDEQAFDKHEEGLEWY